MRVISMFLNDREIARIDQNNNLTAMVEFNGLSKPDLRQWYEDCFYGIKAPSKTFDERFKLAEEHNYFCYSKPGLQLIARIFP